MMRAISLFLIAGLAAVAQQDPLVDGIQAFSKGDYQAAERLLTQSLKQHEDPRARAFLAITVAATGRCDAARADLQNAMETAQGEVRKLAGLALAQCLTNASQFEDAAAVLMKLRAQYPSDADVLYQTAREQMRAWNDTIYQLYKRNPSSFRVNQLSGEIFETQGKFNEAVTEYRKAVAKSPNTLNLHFRLGRALLMSSHSPEKLDEALAEFRAELALNPADAVAEYQVGQILVAQNKSGEAAAHLTTALKLNPDFPEALIALGKLRLDAKQNAQALSLLERAVKLSPKSESAHYALMMAYRDAGDMAAAKREKAELDKLQKVPEGEFTEFLKKLGDKPPEK